jgi:4'-phosphopantetheinyl transferase EntD
LRDGGFEVIEEILPDTVVVEEARVEHQHVSLFAEEEAVVGQAVEKRRREFATARACARKALVRIGLPSQPIPSGAHGEPLWPLAVVGSITHCEGYRACALARASDLLAIGIDAEPCRALPDGVLAEIAGGQELAQLCELARAVPGVPWDRLLFSAKESVYKAWFPLARRRLNFENVGITFDPEGVFSARLLVSGLVLDGVPLTRMYGRWLVREGFLLTAIAFSGPEIQVQD